MLSENTWMTSILGGGVIAAIVMAWQQVKSIFERLTSFLIIRSTHIGTAASAMEFYCWNRLRTSPSGFRTYTSFSRFVKPRDRYMNVAFEAMGKQRRLFWLGWIPMLVYQTDSQVVATFIRGTVDPDKLVNDAMASLDNFLHGIGIKSLTRYRIKFCYGRGRDQYANMKQQDSDSSPGSAPKVLASLNEDAYRPVGWTRDQLGQESEQSGSLNRMAVTPEISSAIVEATQWAASQKWYNERQIPWRRGWLLHGKPGTGKTSLVNGLAQLLDMPIFVFDLGSMTNNEFIREWSNARQESPCIVLFEDIDAVFKGRDNVLGEQGGGLTFDTLLNALSGVAKSNGIFTVITTNRLETIDAALSRPGRVDRILELPALNEDGRRKIATRILSETPDLIDEVVKQGANETGAQFQERCGALALKLYWESLKDGKILEKPIRERYLSLSKQPVSESAYAHADVAQSAGFE